MQAIPAISAGRDVIGLAPTGSGKTLAFVLPFMARLWGFTPSGPGEGPRAMIVVPTRELADQVYAVVRMFSEVERTGFTERGAPHEGGFGDQWWTVYDGQTDYDGGTGVQWWKGYEGQAQCDGGTGEGTGTDSSAYNGQIADQYADGWTAASENHGWEVVNHTADENAHYFEPVANPHKFCSTSYLSSSFHHPNAGTRASYRVLGATGGIPIQSQIQPIRKLGVDVLIGTPGRLIDLFSRGDVRLDRLSYIVLDEVDRMLTLNMEEQLRWILDQIDRTLTPRQCVMFSATLTHHLEQVALGAVFNPITIRTSKTSTSTKPSTSSSSANEDLSASVGSSSEATLEPKQENTGQAIEERVVYFNNRHQKYKLLLKCLRSTPYPPVIVFCNSAKTVDKLTQQLRSEQFHVAGLHSKKNQPYRFRVMSYMRNGTCDVLVATDLVSRGIDIPACTHVINYDVPRTNTVEHEDDSEIEMHGSDSFDSYVHRIGRTARGPSGKGVATTFWFSGEEAHPNPRLDRRLLKCNEIYL
ncbi:P-loop containing nucleoside triphosphate hydrolase protein [Cladochytrium replicatum]|nr:P-loop containing nucleoside triphosphate hydrolase protein [Cladochytrium replicatum]